MRKLIINADDLGYSLAVNEKIEKCIISNVITSCTLMANGPSFEDGVRIANKYKNISVGVHLNIIEFSPLTNIDLFQKYGIVDKNGNFIDGAIFVHPINDELKQAIYNEWDAQIKKIFDAGIIPTHVDSHQHTHCIVVLQDVLCKVLNKYNIRRVRRVDIPSIRLMLFGSKKLPINLDKSQAVLPHRRNVLYRRLHLIQIKFTTHRWNYTMNKHYYMTDYFFQLRTFYLDYKLLSKGSRSSVIELMCHPGQNPYDCETEVLLNLNNWIPKGYNLTNYMNI